MTSTEKRAAYSLASIYSLRMMGLFMILPVFSLYADELEGTTPLLVGLAIGAYGLTQALFQIPFGMLSDRFGRKPVIALGLLIFALGSVLAANADSILGVIFGRALQGTGAIAAAVMALTADLTREEHRSRAMAVIGMSIGLSFALSLVLGPLLGGWIGVDGIFWLTAVLALCGIGVLYIVVPNPKRSIFHRDAEPVPSFFADVLGNKQLLRLDAGVMLLHMMLTATFVALPFALRDRAGIEVADHWHIYLPVLLISLVAMVPLVIIAEKYRHIKGVYLCAILIVAAAEAGLMLFHQTFVGIFIALLLFFLAFNVLEALLPSLVVKYAPAEKKGTAMGVYSTSQFLGAFIGGLSGGAIYGSIGLSGVFMFCTLCALVWAMFARTMKSPRYTSNYMLHVGTLEDDAARVELEERLRQVEGVFEAAIVTDEGAAYLKVDSKVVDYAELDQFSNDEDLQDDADGEKIITA